MSPRPEDLGGPREEIGGPEPPALFPGRLARRIARVFRDPPESESTLWRIPALNAAFLVLSTALLAVVLWAVWRDHHRPWKSFTGEWRSIRAEDDRRKLAGEVERLKALGLEEKERELAEFTARISADGGLEEARREAVRAEGAAARAEDEARLHRSGMAARRYALDEERRRILQDFPEGGERGARRGILERRFLEDWAAPQERLDRAAAALRAVADGLREKVRTASRERAALAEEVAALTRTRDALARGLSESEPSLPHAIRDAPLVPPFAPRDRIQKVVLVDLPESLGQVQVLRVDRCKTCHLNIDDPDPSLARFSDGRTAHGGRLFQSHPQLELYVGAGSPHPHDRFGCTICHGGDGRGTSFTSAAHTSGDARRREEWREKYGLHEPEHPAFAMLPLDHVTASCIQCHPFESRIPGADRLNAGREMAERLGCAGCHRIPGLEGGRKAGPGLRWIASKVVPGFLVRWIEDPPAFRPGTTMPRFLSLTNARGVRAILDRRGERVSVDMARRTEVEALALAAFLGRRRAPEPEEEVPRGPVIPGDPARGRETVKRIGCLGCHSIAREGFEGGDFAPDLGSIGSKVRAEWLREWIRDPRRHDPKARMPRLRIEAGEGGEEKLAGVVAYLMGLRDPAFEGRAAPELSGARGEVLRQLAFELEARAGDRDEAREKVERLPEGDLLLLAGGKLAHFYGCAGCHDGIGEEHDRAPPIGPDLSQEGFKDLARCDFVHWGPQSDGKHAIEPSRAAWIRAKLTDPRIFDTFPRKAAGPGGAAYVPTEEVLEKEPGELLRMPLFSFPTSGRTDGVEPLVTFLLAQGRSAVPDSRIRRLDPDGEAEEEGRRLIRRLNCQGCHRIGADPRWVPIEDLPSFSFEGPEDRRRAESLEKETWLERTVRIGRMTIPRGTFISSRLLDGNDPRAEEPLSVSAIALRHWGASGPAGARRRLAVLGLGEGKVRSSFGGDAGSRAKAPPLLRKEGERVNGDWLFRFLRDVKPIRRWLEIRMPSYALTDREASLLVRWFKLTAGAPCAPPGLGKDEAGSVARWFPRPPGVPALAMDLRAEEWRALALWLDAGGRPPYPHESPPEHGPGGEALELAAEGREMFRVSSPGDPEARRRLGCNTCHPAGEMGARVEDPSSMGPDLALVRERLRPAWIARWLLDPRAYVPDTRMPNHFASFDDPLEPFQVQRPGLEREIEALVQFLVSGQATVDSRQ